MLVTPPRRRCAVLDTVVTPCGDILKTPISTGKRPLAALQMATPDDFRYADIRCRVMDTLMLRGCVYLRHVTIPARFEPVATALNMAAC